MHDSLELDLFSVGHHLLSGYKNDLTDHLFVQFLHEEECGNKVQHSMPIVGELR